MRVRACACVCVTEMADAEDMEDAEHNPHDDTSAQRWAMGDVLSALPGGWGLD